MLRVLVLLALLALAACAGDTTEPTPSSAPSTTSTVESPSTSAGPDTTPEGASETTVPPTLPELDTDAPATLAAEVDGLIDITEQVRSLEFLHSPDITIQPIDEFRAQLDDKIVEDLEPEVIAAEERLLKTMGVLDATSSLEGLTREVLAQQVLGYYDPETKQLFVRDDGVGPSATDRLTIVHELIHALTDQHYAWGEDFLELADSDGGDRFRALQSVIEGDATYFQSVYMVTGMLPSELSEVLADAAEQEEAARGLPPYLIDSLSLPYTTGAFYIQGRGPAVIEDLYLDPPASTEQLLADTDEPPVLVEVPSVSLVGYEVLEEFTRGQGDLEILLDAVAGPGLAAAAAGGWGGDRVAWHWDGQDIVEVSRFVGDTGPDADEYVQALEAWFSGLGQDLDGTTWQTANALFGFQQEGDTVDVVIASDPAAGRAALEQLRS